MKSAREIGEAVLMEQECEHVRHEALAVKERVGVRHSSISTIHWHRFT